jgi:hypothetical protein
LSPKQLTPTRGGIRQCRLYHSSWGKQSQNYLHEEEDDLIWGGFALITSFFKQIGFARMIEKAMPIERYSPNSIKIYGCQLPYRHPLQCNTNFLIGL